MVSFNSDVVCSSETRYKVCRRNLVMLQLRRWDRQSRCFYLYYKNFRVSRVSQNLDGGWTSAQNRPHLPQVLIGIKGWIEECFKNGLKPSPSYLNEMLVSR